jgi:beta-hydroxylase
MTIERSSSDIYNNFNQKDREPLYFNVIGKWYKGKMPTFYDNSQMELTRILESNFPAIQKEILAFYQHNGQEFLPQYVPYKYQNDNWKVFSLMGFLLKFSENIKKFPVLSKVVIEIPDIVTAQIIVLEPHTRVKAHFAGSNGLIRSHLGIMIPGKLPELGFRIKQEERCWEEGKVLSFCESHRHYVWNYTNDYRIILLIDTIHPDYSDKKHYLCGGMLSMLTLKMFAFHFPLTKKMPKKIVLGFHHVFTLLFIVALKIQDKFNLNLLRILQPFKLKRKSSQIYSDTKA